MSIWLPSRSSHVSRGGSWLGDPHFARVAARSSGAPGRRSNRLGVRFVRRCT